MMNKIQKSLSEIILFYPMFSIITSGWEKIEETRQAEIPVSTMATNGVKLVYNAEFVEKLSQEELTAVLMHEIFHCVFLHPTEITTLQAKTKVKILWEIAMEIVVNAAVRDTQLNKLPGDAIDPIQDDVFTNTKEGYYYNSMGHTHTAEEIYQVLYDKYKDRINQQPAAMSPLGGDVLPNPDKNQAQEALEKSIATLEKLQKSRGNLPAGLKRLLQRLKSSKTPWQRLLQHMVGSIVKGAEDFSWCNPNWKHPLSNEIVLPGEIDYQIEDIVVATDTSGSISKEELEAFAGEIARISQFVSEITVLTCDCKVHEKVKVRSAGELLRKLQFKGGGGTDFRPVFKTVKNCACLIFLTDGYGTYPEQPPKYPVIWVLTRDHQEPPWGKKIILN